MTYFLPSVQKTCLLRSVHFKLNKLETVLNCKQVQTLNIEIDLTFCQGMARLAVGAVGLAAPVFVFPGQGHTIERVQRDLTILYNDFMILVSNSMTFDDIRIYLLFFSWKWSNTLRNYHSNSRCSCFKVWSKLSEGAAPRPSQCLSQTGCSWFVTLTPDRNDDANKDKTCKYFHDFDLCSSAPPDVSTF